MSLRLYPQAGFTLVELLVALAILGMLTGLLTAGLGGTIRVFDRIHWQTAKIAELSLAQRILRDHLAQAVIVQNDPDFHISGIAGDQDRIRWRGYLSADLNGAEAKFDLVLNRENAMLELVIEGVKKTPALETFKLMDEVTDVRMTYFGTLERDAAWHDHWPENASSLPRLIKIQLQSARHSNLPALTIRLQHAQG